MNSSILLVEDEVALGDVICLSLKKLGYQVHWSQSLASAFLLFRSKEPSLILLDRMLPDGDGLDFCESIRREAYKGGVLLLTARGDTSDRVDGLFKGADDYLAKPFSFDELNARICAILRRLPKDKQTILWQYDIKNLKIKGPKGWVALTPLEFKLTQYLICAQESIVTRDELLNKVWGFTLLPKTRTVDLFITKLRK